MASASAPGPVGASNSSPFSADALRARKLPLPNPGGFEEALRDVMRIFVNNEVFEGAKLEMTKPVRQTEPILAIHHGVTMGAHGGTYNFGANYFGEGQKTLLLGKMDAEGTLRANIIKQWSDTFVTRLQAQVTNQNAVFNYEFEKKGADYTGTLKMINDQVVFAQYMQSVTPSLALGAELLYARHNMHSTLNFAARYTAPQWTLALKADTEGDRHIAYTHKVTEQLTMATDVTYNSQQRDSTFRVGYEYVLRTARMRAMIESNGKIASLLEEQILPGVNFQLCGQVNYKKKEYKFGVGLVVGMM